MMGHFNPPFKLISLSCINAEVSGLFDFESWVTHMKFFVTGISVNDVLLLQFEKLPKCILQIISGYLKSRITTFIICTSYMTCTFIRMNTIGLMLTASWLIFLKKTDKRSTSNALTNLCKQYFKKKVEGLLMILKIKTRLVCRRKYVRIKNDN